MALNKKMGIKMDQNVFKVDFTAKKVEGDLQEFPNLEWVIAGVEVLKKYGPRLMSVDKICEEFGENEEEFYNRFDDLDSFLGSLLDYWYEIRTLTYIAMMDDISGSAEDVARAMCEIIHNIDKEDEIAIRNWALRCPRAYKAMEKVDRTRIDVATGLFHEMGFSDKDAEHRAKLFYASSIGTEYTAFEIPLEMKLDMLELLMRKD